MALPRPAWSSDCQRLPGDVTPPSQGLSSAHLSPATCVTKGRRDSHAMPAAWDPLRPGIRGTRIGTLLLASCWTRQPPPSRLAPLLPGGGIWKLGCAERNLPPTCWGRRRALGGLAGFCSLARFHPLPILPCKAPPPTLSSLHRDRPPPQTKLARLRVLTLVTVRRPCGAWRTGRWGREIKESCLNNLYC